MPGGETWLCCARRQYCIVFILGSSIAGLPECWPPRLCGILVSSMMSNIYVLLVNKYIGTTTAPVWHFYFSGHCLPLLCPLWHHQRRRSPPPPTPSAPPAPSETSDCPGLCEETTHSFPTSSSSLPGSQQTKTWPTTKVKLKYSAIQANYLYLKEVPAEAKVDCLHLPVLLRQQQEPPADQVNNNTTLRAGEESNFDSGGEREQKYSRGESLMLFTILRAPIFSTRRKTMPILLTREALKQR